MKAGVETASKTMAWTKTKKAVVWGTVGLLVLAATTLFLQRHNIANWMMVSGGKRAVANHIATPVDLTSYYGAPASAFENSPSFWGKLPWEFQVFRHVPLQIDGIMYLWGEGNAKMGNDFPEQILGIAVNQRFETLYVYHCTFFGSPKNTPVYDLVFRYDNGDSATNTIRYGVDTLDFNTPGKRTVPPSSPNTKVGWVGSSFTPDGRRPLLFSLTAIKNPQPSLKVASIDLFSCKKQSAGVILAMTTGPSGLMK
jgi:hypothetical protein